MPAKGTALSEAPAEPGDAAGRRCTEDAFLGGRLRLRQPVDGYRAAIDPVFLAASVDAAAGDRVLDVGAGHGAAALCLARRVPGCHVTGIEVQPGFARLAGENARANGLAGSVGIVAADLMRPALAPADFDHVMANPPYLERGRGTPPRSRDAAAARAEGDVGLGEWIGFMHRMARPRGVLTLIHRADRLDRILSLLDRRCGAVTVFPLWPRSGVAAKRVIVRARKDVAAPAAIAPGLVLHGNDGAFTAEADAVLRGAALRVASG